MIQAICQEIRLRADYLRGQSIETIYLGGGTPSLLDNEDLELIFKTLNQYLDLSNTIEVTLEANPDDLSKEKLHQLLSTPINRLSIGIQSFDEDSLRFMRRAHNAQQSKESIEYAVQCGFSNISIDLIYGVPSQHNNIWEKNLDIVANLAIPHLSCYALTVEPRTILQHQINKGKIPPLQEEQAAREYQTLLSFASTYGYEAYEISNLARNGFYSRHNTSYWEGKHYLGIGPSAHSYNGHSRSWNIAHNARYIQSLNQGQLPLETEVLSETDRFNEWIMTGLRTLKGLKKTDLQGWSEGLQHHFMRAIEPYLISNQIHHSEGHFILTSDARLFADGISASLFWVDK